MSTQKGNTQRSRPQKYQNTFAFKNSLHDKTKKTKTINNLQVANVCERCKKIIEWKIKYKKYKPLKAPAKCNKCEQKTVKHAYHTMCGPCAKERSVCPKCESETDLVAPVPTKEEQYQLDLEMQKMLKTLPERKRRTFIRYMNKHVGKKSSKKSDFKDEENGSMNGETEVNPSEEEPSEEFTREHLLNKLKFLMVDEGKDNDDLDDFLDNSSDDKCGDDDEDEDDD